MASDEQDIPQDAAQEESAPPAPEAGSSPEHEGAGPGGSPEAEGAEASASAGDAGASAQAPPEAQEIAPDAGGPTPLQLQALDRDDAGELPENLSLLSDVNLNVTIELGRTRMLVEDVLKLGAGAVVELDKLAGDPVDIYVNDRPVARGEVLVLNDNFCVRVNEILAPKLLDAAMAGGGGGDAEPVARQGDVPEQAAHRKAS